MRIPVTIFIAISCSFLLSACGTIDDVFGTHAKSEIKTSEPAVSMTESMPEVIMQSDTSRLDQAPGVRPVPAFPKPRDEDLMIMTDKLAGSTVEIFDLDSGTSNAMQGTMRSSHGMPSSADPSVTVFPLDGGTTYPGQAPFQGHSMTGSGMSNFPGHGMGTSSGDTQIFFKYGSSRLGHNDMARLSDVAETAKFSPVSRIRVEGHASKRTQSSDPVQARILNLKESMNRSFAVSKTLIQKGVPAEKIKTVAWGDTMPPANGQDRTARRVDIYTGGGQ